MADATDNAASGAGGAPAARSSEQQSINANLAGWFGIVLIALGLVTFGAAAYFSDSFSTSSLGFGAVSGVLILSVSLYGLIALTRAIGMADGTQALALPNGSVRALLALILAIVFIAVSSWSLGGLFDPLGPLVYKTSVKKGGDDEKKALEPYSDKQYVVFKSDSGDQETVKVYLKREAPPDSVVDIAKQIMTISATVLVTIVGFYFGSKSAADGVRSAGAGLSAMRDVLGSQGGEGDSPDGAPPTAADVAAAASAIDSLTSTGQKTMQDLGATPLASLHAAADGRDDAKDLLATAEASFAALSASQKACANFASQAKTLTPLPAGADADAVKATADNTKKLLAEATKANQDFIAAVAAFKAARDQIYAITAKG
jgi:hypothetical protein